MRDRNVCVRKSKMYQPVFNIPFKVNRAHLFRSLELARL